MDDKEFRNLMKELGIPEENIVRVRRNVKDTDIDIPVKQLNYTDLPNYNLGYINWIPTNVHPDGWYFWIPGKVQVKLNHRAPHDINSSKEENKLTDKERKMISSGIEEFLGIDDTKEVKILLPNGQTADLEKVGISWNVYYRNTTCLPYYCVDTLGLYTRLVDKLIPFASKDNL